MKHKYAVQVEDTENAHEPKNISKFIKKLEKQDQV